MEPVETCTAPASPTELALLDWRRRTSELYACVRARRDPLDAWAYWRSTRDRMLRTHPQSPLRAEERDGYPGGRYFAYDPTARVLATVEAATPQRLEIATSHGTTYRFTRFADARFRLAGSELALPLYWLDGYGGGVFLPFADETNGQDTYGAGRYLLDTVKGADLGSVDHRLVLDFNFAYNPSCAYDPNWLCPLAPEHSRLPIRVLAGELKPAPPS